VTKDSASLTKPLVKLIRADTTMMAMIAQSTQVNDTVTTPCYAKSGILAEQ